MGTNRAGAGYCKSGTRRGRAVRAAHGGPGRTLARPALALFLLAVLVAGSLPAPGSRPPGVSAATGAPVTFVPHYYADVSEDQGHYLDVAGVLGLMPGERGHGARAYPRAAVSRAEFAYMVVRLLRLDPGFVPPAGADASLPFTDAADVPGWAQSSVAICGALGLMSGTPDGRGGVKFEPNAPVTGAEAMSMLLRALDNAGSVRGGWPIGYIYRAYEVGLLSTEPVPGDWRFIEPMTPVTRAHTAYLLTNALFCSRGFSPGRPGSEGTFARGPIGGRLAGYALVTGFDGRARTITFSGGQVLRVSDVLVADNITGPEDLVGRHVFWLKNRTGEIGYIRGFGREIAVVGTLAGLETDPTGVMLERISFAGGRTIPCARSAVVELNGAPWPFDLSTPRR